MNLAANACCGAALDIRRGAADGHFIGNIAASHGQRAGAADVHLDDGPLVDQRCAVGKVITDMISAQCSVARQRAADLLNGLDFNRVRFSLFCSGVIDLGGCHSFALRQIRQENLAVAHIQRGAVCSRIDICANEPDFAASDADERFLGEVAKVLDH